jgi:mycofactocin precursor
MVAKCAWPGTRIDRYAAAMEQDTIVAPAESPAVADARTEPAEDALVEEELLIEEISIDGMCGVY